MPERRMKLETIHIQNLRAFKDQYIDVDSYTTFVGSNGSGKSTVLFALNVFFRNIRGTTTDPVNLSKEDFHNQTPNEPISITLTFGALSTKAKEVLQHYVRQGKFIVTAKATWDEARQRASVEHVGTRLVMEEFAPYFEAKVEKKLVAELRTIYQKLMQIVPELPSETTGQRMEAALRTYEEDHPDRCKPIESRNELFGVSKGADRIGELVQWIYVPAVMDASAEAEETKNSAIGDLLERTVRGSIDFTAKLHDIRQSAQESYRQLLEDNDGALRQISTRLTDRLKRIAHGGASLELRWSQQPEKAVSVSQPFAKTRISEFQQEAHEVSRCGHGLQRAYLLAILQELSRHDDEEGPTLLLGIEEPELYQHPTQAKHLATILRELSKGNAQILLTTHSPFFVSAIDFEGVRAVRRTGLDMAATVTGTSLDLVSKRLAKANGRAPEKPEGLRARLLAEFTSPIAEAFFAPCFVLVEGIEDEAYIKTHAILAGHWDEMRRLGLSVVCANGKNHIHRMLAVAQEMQIPVYTIFDADGHEQRQDYRDWHKKDNEVLLRLQGIGTPDAFPTADAIESTHAVWVNTLADSVTNDLTGGDLEKWKDAARKACGAVKDAHKNPIFIAELLETASQSRVHSNTLESLCQALLAFARRAAGQDESMEDQK